MNSWSMVTNDRQALAMSLYFRLSLSLFGAEFVLWAYKKLTMFNAGIPMILLPGWK